MHQLKVNCPDCPDFGTCKQLCPGAEGYVNQDHIRRKESLFGDDGEVVSTKYENKLSHQILSVYLQDIVDKRQMIGARKKHPRQRNPFWNDNETNSPVRIIPVHA